MFQLKFGGYVQKLQKEDLEVLAGRMQDREFCYEVLNKVSRSFAVVIQQLPEILKDAVCVFYLILRGLDSVEDDMTYDNSKKVPLLTNFYKYIEDETWSIEGVGDKEDYRKLLKHFQKVIRVYKGLEPSYRRVISDITKKMGAGMAEFATKTKSIDTIRNYNLYCHYVAGLVGHGLGGLFSASGLEDSDLKDKLDLANSMGTWISTDVP